MRRLVDWTSAICILTLTYYTIWEYCRFHLSANILARRFSALRASRPTTPSTEYTRGVKSFRISRQLARYLPFFSFRDVQGSWRLETSVGNSGFEFSEGLKSDFLVVSGGYPSRRKQRATTEQTTRDKR